MANPILQRFFQGRAIIPTKFNEPAEISLIKRRIIGEKYLTQTTASSVPFFQAKGNYLIMRSIVIRNQSAVHEGKHERGKLRCQNLSNSVSPLFNKLLNFTQQK